MADKLAGKVPMQEYDPYLTISGIPNYTNNSYETGRFRSNSLGFRSPEIQDKKSFRVIVLGGSVVWGTGASSNETTFPARIKEILKNKYKHNIEVINAGMGAYFSFQELTLLIHKLIYLEPDLVIFFNGYNDIFYATQIEESQYIYNQVQTYYELKSYLLLSTAAGRKQDLLTIIKRKISKKLPSRFNSSKVDRADKFSTYSGSYAINLKGVRNYIINMEMTFDILSAQGISSSYILQPYLPFSKKTLTEEESTFLKAEQRKKKKIGVFMSMYAELEKGLERIEKSKNLSRENYLDVFDEETEQCFFDHAHTTDYGNMIIAKRISKWINNNMSLDEI